MVHVLVFRVDISVVTHESMTSQCWRSVIQVLVIRVDIGVVTYEAMTMQRGVSVSLLIKAKKVIFTKVKTSGIMEHLINCPPWKMF